jgi:23S rRNA pseudouridine1911/1915/1917 synthase
MSEAPRVLEIRLGDAPDQRLDKALAAAVPEGLGLSRSRLQALIGQGAVTRVSGEILRDPKLRVWPGETVRLRLGPPKDPRAAPEDIPLDIRFEDDDLIVLMKPAGLVVHPAPGAEAGTLVNALIHHCGGRLSGVGGVRRPGIVHRIDKETSGLLVVAKSDRAHQGLAAQFAAHSVDRAYLALVWGVPDAADPRLAGLPGVAWEPAGWLRIEGNIGRHPGDRKRMAVVKGAGRSAVTRVRVMERLGPVALVECRLETGRTHQIRVHMAHAGHALVGDPVYGRRRTAPAGTEAEVATALAGFGRQALHAARLGFVHPVSGARLDFAAEPPEDFTSLLALLRRSGKSAPFNGT